MADAVVFRSEEQVRSTDLYKSSGWWGMVFTIATEGAVFAYLLFSYYYLAIVTHAAWPHAHPSLKFALPNTFVLLFSGVTFWWSEAQFAAGRSADAVLGLIVTFLLGSVFAVVQLVEWHGLSFSMSSGPYGSLYYTLTGFHLAHIIVGLMIMLSLILWAGFGVLQDRRQVAISIGAAYWYFVEVVWLTVFFTLYLTPYLS
jgi:heme/copper-type cytochrome/quinol oxidase subunit 3